MIEPLSSNADARADSITNEEPAVELPIRAVPNREIRLVDSLQGLVEAIAELKAASGPFAVDAERASGFRYGQSAYLIQIAREDTSIFLLDPVAFHGEEHAAQLSELSGLLADAPWILHAASQDLACLAEIGFSPVQLFDTELGSRILGLERVGLGFVCESQLGFKLAKEHSAVDWSTRPLPNDWLNYAALDVDVLFELWQKISSQLIAKSKMEWAIEEFEHVRTMQPKDPKPDRWRSMTGLHEIKDAHTLTIASHLWHSREELAKKLDTAPGRLIPDSSIISVLKANPRTKAELAALRSFTGRASRNYIDLWWQAIASGAATRDVVDVKVKSTGMPNHRIWPNRFPEAAHRLSIAKAALVKISEEQALPSENLLTPDYLRQICFEEIIAPTAEIVAAKLFAAGARRWQIELVSKKLTEALRHAKDSYVSVENRAPNNAE